MQTHLSFDCLCAVLSGIVILELMFNTFIQQYLWCLGCCLLAKCKCGPLLCDVVNLLYGHKWCDHLAHRPFTLYPCCIGFMENVALVMFAVCLTQSLEARTCISCLQPWHLSSKGLLLRLWGSVPHFNKARICFVL